MGKRRTAGARRRRGITCFVCWHTSLEPEREFPKKLMAAARCKKAVNSFRVMVLKSAMKILTPGLVRPKQENAERDPETGSLLKFPPRPSTPFVCVDCYNCIRKAVDIWEDIAKAEDRARTLQEEEFKLNPDPKGVDIGEEVKELQRSIVAAMKTVKRLLFWLYVDMKGIGEVIREADSSGRVAWKHPVDEGEAPLKEFREDILILATELERTNELKSCRQLHLFQVTNPPQIEGPVDVNNDNDTPESMLSLPGTATGSSATSTGTHSEGGKGLKAGDDQSADEAPGPSQAMKRSVQRMIRNLEIAESGTEPEVPEAEAECLSPAVVSTSRVGLEPRPMAKATRKPERNHKTGRFVRNDSRCPE